MQFFLFSFSPSSPLPSPPPSERTRGTASSRQAEKEKRGREKEGLWRRDKGLSVSVCHLIHRPLLRPAGPSVIRCHTHTQKYKHTLSTNFHTLNNNKHTSKESTNFDSLSALFHTFTGLTHTHTHTFTATMTNTQQPGKPHTNFLVGLSAPFHTFSDDTDTQTALQFHTLGGDSRTRQSLGNGDGKHKFACSRARTWAPACQMLFRKVNMWHRHTHPHTQLRLASWILIGVVQFCPPLCFSQDPKTRRPQHTIGPLPVLDCFSASGSRTHFIATGRNMKAASATCVRKSETGQKRQHGTRH